ncbi:hypothetical protein [Actinomyces sp. ZJ308]|uniref:hypothetical protein n=1 Tax=Actinomyces sp. ZJ308 TaxID=2708342 RepID=UPI00141D7F56|nr:hypothetical protein [Actinomyces sp. ZJ308]
MQNTDELLSVSTPTNGGSFISTELRNNTLTVASSTPRTDAPQWAIDITLSHSPNSDISWADFSERGLIDRLSSTTAGALVVSPNGDYVSIAMQVEPKQQSESEPLDRSRRADAARQRRGYVIVLDAKTGKTVLTREVSGFILAQALTNDHLAVETAEAYFPAGAGKGTITTLPLNDPSSPTTIATDQWLVGAGQRSLLLSPQPLYFEMCDNPCGPFILTRMGTDGTALGTITHADRVYRGGWVQRHKDSIPDGEARAYSAPAGTEVVGVDTGAVVDISGGSADERGVPTGPGLLISQTSTDENGNSVSTPVFWLSAADDGHPHTENLEQFSNK